MLLAVIVELAEGLQSERKPARPASLTLKDSSVDEPRPVLADRSNMRSMVRVFMKLWRFVDLPIAAPHSMSLNHVTLVPPAGHGHCRHGVDHKGSAYIDPASETCLQGRKRRQMQDGC